MSRRRRKTFANRGAAGEAFEKPGVDTPPPSRPRWHTCPWCRTQWYHLYTTSSGTKGYCLHCSYELVNEDVVEDVADDHSGEPGEEPQEGCDGAIASVAG